MGNNENYGKMFYDKFKENISNKLKKNPKDYFNNQKCTEMMLSELKSNSPQDLGSAHIYITDCVIGKTIKDVFGDEILIDREYYKIDMIGWKQNKTKIESKCEELNLKPYCWSLEVAVEHENDSKEWLDEVCKLSFIKCPLRVVIGYGYDNEDVFKDKINIVKQILEYNNAFSDEKQEFLIILGKTKRQLSETKTTNDLTSQDIANGYSCEIITAKDIGR